MKNIFSLLILLILSCATLVTTQAQGLVTPGYEIKIIATNMGNDKLFLQAYNGQESFMFDSAKVKGHKNVVFKNAKKIIPSGIYSVVDRNGNEYANLIIDQNRKLTITGGEWNARFVTTATVEGSDENAQFIEFQKQLLMSNNPSSVAGLFYEAAPASFLGHFIKGKFNINPYLPLNETVDTADATAQYQRLIDHYFDAYTFEDSRLLHTPIYLDINNYFVEILPQSADMLILKSDEFLNRFNAVETHDYYLALLMNIFDHSVNNMAAEQVFVHLFDKYCDGKSVSTISEDLAKYYKRSADRKRRLLPGKTIPVLSAFDLNHTQHKSSDIDKERIIIWFWDPDCDECKEMTPKLHEFYKEFANYYNFDVFAVAITEDLELWDKFCKENQLSWINTCDGVDTPNYDFIDYFDIITTPVIYLLDKNHTIIAHSFPLEELHDYLNH